MLRERKIKKLDFDKHLRLPDFPSSAARTDRNWKVAKQKKRLKAHQVAPLPARLQRRHLDLGDVSPALTDRFIQCLQQVNPILFVFSLPRMWMGSKPTLTMVTARHGTTSCWDGGLSSFFCGFTLISGGTCTNTPMVS